MDDAALEITSPAPWRWTVHGIPYVLGKIVRLFKRLDPIKREGLVALAELTRRNAKATHREGLELFLALEEKDNAALIRRLRRISAAALMGMVLYGGYETTMRASPIPDMSAQVRVDEQGCAEWVINTFANLHTLGKPFTAAFGIVGNAWDMFGNLVGGVVSHVSPSEAFAQRLGSERVLFTAFPDIHAAHAARIAALREEIRSRFALLKARVGSTQAYRLLNEIYAPQVRDLFPSHVAVDPHALRAGDIVGLFYSESPSQVRAFMETTSGTFNTHVGIVTQTAGGVTISHNMHGTLHHDSLDTLLSPDNPSHSMVVWVVRPVIDVQN
jgi:hypothetical protein